MDMVDMDKVMADMADMAAMDMDMDMADMLQVIPLITVSRP
jgi:hypothetical protein